MAATCPDGHDSSADDYCSVCGLAMATTDPDPSAPASSGDAAPPGPGLSSVGGQASGSLACPHCGAGHGRDDVFCEACGYDFITGSLPRPEPALTSAARPVGAGGTARVLAEVTVSVDAAFHARMDTDGVLSLPDPVPAPVVIPLTNSPVLVGRASPSRNIHPDLDVSGDPAASGRHARFDRRPDGVWTITDLDSTNGTYLGATFEQLTPNQATPLPPDAPVYLGAWTRIDLAPTT